MWFLVHVYIGFCILANCQTTCLYYSTTVDLYSHQTLFKLKLQYWNAQFRSTWAIFFCPIWPWNLTDVLEKQYSISSVLRQDMCIISKPSVNWNWSYFLETLNSGHNWRFLSRVTLKFDGWPCKTKWHLFYATSSLAHHLMAMGEFKLESQSINAQF